jgi:hypothetical protein
MGWTTFMPAHYVLGSVAIWVYTRISPRYGPGPNGCQGPALAAWVVLWVIPEMALQSLKLFPHSLLFMVVIAIALLDSIPPVLLGTRDPSSMNLNATTIRVRQRQMLASRKCIGEAILHVRVCHQSRCCAQIDSASGCYHGDGTNLI